MAAFGQVVSAISIHALLAESDRHILIPLRWMTSFLSTLSLRRATDRSWRKQSNHHKFLSTLSLRRATRIEPDQVPGYTISIHALLAESDAAMGNPTFEIAYFYPRSPCGERHLRVVDGSKSSIISIHALLAESDYDTSSLMKCQVKFLSTLSLRRATH